MSSDPTLRELRELLLTSLDEAYERKSWHGPNLRASLRGVSAAEALERPGKGRHNIWELAVHAAYWKYAARRRIAGTPRGGFSMKGSNWIAAPERPRNAEWREVLRLLDVEHRTLRETIATMSDVDLRDPKKLRIVRGVAAHDLYHAGQIQLVKRLVR